MKAIRIRKNKTECDNSFEVVLAQPMRHVKGIQLGCTSTHERSES